MMQLSSHRLRIGVVCDLLEENWPSMDLVGDMLLAHLRNGSGAAIDASCIRPPMRRHFTKPGGRSSKLAFDGERFLNRYWDYPRFLRRHRQAFDLFHVIDHSYAQLVLELPPMRTLVTCHDLDAFRCLLPSHRERRSPWFRAMVRRTLRGLQMAALVVCPSIATRDELLAHNLVPRERLRVVKLGTHPTCTAAPDPSSDHEIEQLLGEPSPEIPELLHVGATLPRKRIEFLLQVFAGVKRQFPAARLIRAGGRFTADQDRMIDKLRLRDSIVALPYLERRLLAAVYRRATMLLLPSEREGFGLPVIEAMACGTPAVATDLPVLREVGGVWTTYCSRVDAEPWVSSISDLMRERHDDPAAWNARRDNALKHASRFTWKEHTGEMVALYQEVVTKGTENTPG
jgi:glycosyltransferase involved in cell wall biosynthesis